MTIREEFRVAVQVLKTHMADCDTCAPECEPCDLILPVVERIEVLYKQLCAEEET